MAVIDLTDDPRIDMAMAQSIGNILTSVGQAEQNRQRRFQMDQIMSDISSGASPDAAIQRANQSEAPRDKGLMGVWQGAGRLLGGSPRNITDAMVEDSLMGKLREKRNRYLQLKQTEDGYANYDPLTGSMTPVEGGFKPPSKAVDKDKAYLDLKYLVEKYKDNMDQRTLTALNNKANKLGLRVVKTEDKSKYLPGTETSDDGMKYRELEDGSVRRFNPIYKIEIEEDPLPSRELFGLGGGTQEEQARPPSTPSAPSAPPPSGKGEVVLVDNQGQAVGSMPELPNRTYVEIDGKTFTIPDEQLNDFRATYPKANVYETRK